ncbi:Retrotransposon-derived protein peg10 [Haplosporangium sp. Z 767]|nr:Retrotransposon-derived protein peg10 [Haplosporangium sp. Z 767]
MYGDQYTLEEVQHKLNRLRQTGSMSEYLTKFRVLSARSGWNEDALLFKFKNSLSDDVKNILTPQWHTLTTLRAARAAANTAYQNLQAQQRSRHRVVSALKNHQKSQPHQHFRPQQASSSAQSNASAPSSSSMDLDTMKTKHITAEEKQRRRDKGLCLYCGGDDHFAASCPAKKARVAVVSLDSENESA